MTKRRTNVPKLIGARSAFIDPMTCQSRVAYTCVYSKYNALSMSVILSDCDRQIKWDFTEWSATDPLAKLNAAIAALHEARRVWVEGMAHFRKKNPKHKVKYASA